MRVLTKREWLQRILDQIPNAREKERCEAQLDIDLLDAEHEFLVVQRQRLLYKAWLRCGSMSVRLLPKVFLSYRDQADPMQIHANTITEHPDNAFRAYSMARRLAELLLRE